MRIVIVDCGFHIKILWLNMDVKLVCLMCLYGFQNNLRNVFLCLKFKFEELFFIKNSIEL